MFLAGSFGKETYYHTIDNVALAQKYGKNNLKLVLNFGSPVTMNIMSVFLLSFLPLKNIPLGLDDSHSVGRVQKPFLTMSDKFLGAFVSVNQLKMQIEWQKANTEHPIGS